MARKKSPVKGRRSRKTTQRKRADQTPETVAAEASLPADTPDESEEVSAAGFPIAGIGASAGGLEAFTEMLEALPDKTGIAYVFIQHLDPKHASLLTEILQRSTKMPVEEATEGVKVEPDHIYVIPRNSHLNLVKGTLQLTSRQMSLRPHMPIDPFLRSLAEDQGGKAIGVILSGNASDGTLGMRAIKAAGGITFAQSSESAKSDGMPRSAIAAGCVDFILEPKAIARELARLGQHPYIAFTKPEKKQEPAPHDGMRRIMALVRTATGVDFAYYKHSTIQRRILRRMALRGFDTLETYLEELRSNPAEVRELYEDILINVTEFFRDPAMFAGLKKFVFPKFERSHGKRGPIRIWVPGCASGEEAYSIAIALIEYLEARRRETPIQIFATDISEVALEKARNGIYPAGVVNELSAERIRRFFTKQGAGYQVSKRIREMCVFAVQNIVKDLPFSKLDLVSCRNVLIYLGPVLQKRALTVFHYALKPDGFLLLGSSETIGPFDELFEPVNKKLKIYARRPGPGRIAADLIVEPALAEMTEAPMRADPWPESELTRTADKMVLARFGPPGVVVDEDLNIVQFRGQTSPFLEPSPGAASLNLLRMAREGLFVELRNALNRVRRENKPLRREGLRMRRGSDFLSFNMDVIPFKRSDRRSHRYLILFEKASSPEESTAAGKKPVRRKEESLTERQNRQLRQDLTATKEYLQSIIEEQESSNEELRSANEEIQSSNEELRSTNEELESAKEELQSINEELNTVNEELQNRNTELAQTGNDLSNLLDNTNIPILMLGNDLRLRRFTPAAGRMLSLGASDIGRSIQEISMNLDVSELPKAIFEVIGSLTPRNVEAKDMSGRRHLLRIRPYRTEDNRIDGAVLVLVDLENAQEELGSSIVEHAEKRSEELHAFSSELLMAQERERGHLARELHDDFNQRLALLEMDAARLERKPPPPEQVQAQVQAFRKQIASLSDDLRRVAYRLHPAALDSLGLAAVVENYVRDFSKREQIAVELSVKDIPDKIPPDTALGVFRVLQESLRNVSQHSKAKSAEVRLTGRDHHLRLMVKDSGNGFVRDVVRDRGGLGLFSMEERVRLLGGAIQIKSVPKKGTEISIDVPCPPGPDGTEKG